MTATFQVPQGPNALALHRRMPKLARWLLLSMILHALLLAYAPRLRMQLDNKSEPPSMTVTLRSAPAEREITPEAAPAPPPEPAAAPPKPPPPRKAPRERPVREAAPKETKDAVIALPKPVPDAPRVPAPAPAPVAPPTPVPQVAEAPPAPVTPQVTAPLPAETDLAAYIEARRRARGEGVDPTTVDVERANRGAINSTALKQPAPTRIAAENRRNGYGSFDIRRRGYDYAEYMFKGWNENFRREGLELIEVRKGNHATIDIAVIRSMIEIIRRTENGDFPWYSHRLGRTLRLSARPADNAGLEDFLMKEFYDDLHRYR